MMWINGSLAEEDFSPRLCSPWRHLYTFLFEDYGLRSASAPPPAGQTALLRSSRRSDSAAASPPASICWVCRGLSPLGWVSSRSCELCVSCASRVAEWAWSGPGAEVEAAGVEVEEQLVLYSKDSREIFARIRGLIHRMRKVLERKDVQVPGSHFLGPSMLSRWPWWGHGVTGSQRASEPRSDLNGQCVGGV